MNTPRRESKPEPSVEAPRLTESARSSDAAPEVVVVAKSTSTRTRSDAHGTAVETMSETAVLSAAMRDCQGDAPACDACGAITVRNGACYKCLNCGHSMGCS